MDNVGRKILENTYGEPDVKKHLKNKVHDLVWRKLRVAVQKKSWIINNIIIIVYEAAVEHFLTPPELRRDFKTKSELKEFDR